MRKTLIILFFLTLGICFVAKSQNTDITASVTNAIKTQNAASLAKLFNSSIELVILDKDEIYSREQAEMIIDSFFKKHKPLNFTVHHKGGPDDAQFAIGTMKTVEKNFRVYFLVKKTNDKSLIHQFRIENENE